MGNDVTSGGPSLAVTRVRHPLKFRLARVKRIDRMTPHLIRFTLEGSDLEDFVSLSFDDHMKVMIPPEGASMPLLPTLGPDGPVFPGGKRPTMRDYTPRRHDRAACELDIEFVLHEAGPATSWAAGAKIGDHLGIGGPRGSMIIPPHFDWHLLIGDDTALPAIARRLEELPAGTRAMVLAEVSDPSARIDFHSRAETTVTWCYRASNAGGQGLLDALHGMPPLPSGEGFAWAAAEASLVRQVRAVLCGERGIDKARTRAAAYWKQGSQAIHEVIDD